MEHWLYSHLVVCQKGYAYAETPLAPLPGDHPFMQSSTECNKGCMASKNFCNYWDYDNDNGECRLFKGDWEKARLRMESPNFAFGPRACIFRKLKTNKVAH